MFVLSKLTGLLTQPANIVLLVFLAGVGLLFTRYRQAGRTLLCVLAAVLVAVAVLPWSAWVVRPLENRFPMATALPERVDGIVVLGGAVDPVVTAARGQPSLNGAIERVTSMVALAERYPDARLVFTGGSGAIATQDLKEAPVVKAFLEEIGFDAGRVIFEAQSRNTWENAELTKALVAPRPGETWVLVTSALHMPRAVGAFRAARWPVVPYPVDYSTTGAEQGLGFSLGGGLSTLTAAWHEWLGLVYYRLRGWSDSLYPGPSDRL